MSPGRESGECNRRAAELRGHLIVTAISPERPS